MADQQQEEARHLGTFRPRMDPFHLYNDAEFVRRFSLNRAGLRYVTDLVREEIRNTTERSMAVSGDENGNNTHTHTHTHNENIHRGHALSLLLFSCVCGRACVCVCVFCLICCSVSGDNQTLPYRASSELISDLRIGYMGWIG